MEFREYSLLLIFVGSLAVILAASEIGHRLGLRIGVRGADNISTLESAVLGLLALMIGFTFAMALSLYEARRDAVMLEASSIGTTALRARLLPAADSAQILKLLKQSRVRRDPVDPGP